MGDFMGFVVIILLVVAASAGFTVNGQQYELVECSNGLDGGFCFESK